MFQRPKKLPVIVDIGDAIYNSLRKGFQQRVAQSLAPQIAGNCLFYCQTKS